MVGASNFTPKQSVQIYEYAKKNIIPHVARGYDLTDPPTKKAKGPFDSVPPVYWAVMVTAIPSLGVAHGYNTPKEKASVHGKLKRHCNNYFHKGHPIHNMKIECKSKTTRSFSEFMECLLQLGVSQQLQRRFLRIADPDGDLQRPAHVPLKNINPSKDHWQKKLNASTSEEAKLFSDLLHWLDNLVCHSDRARNDLILQYLRKNCEFVTDNATHLKHYQNEFQRLKADSPDTVASAAYTAVFRDLAGLEVPPYVLYGVDLGKALREEYDKLLKTNEGKIAVLIIDLVFGGQQNIVQLIIKDPKWAKAVMEVAMRVRGEGHQYEDYYKDKLRRIDNKETCHFDNCPFCGDYSLVFFILSDLHHLGKDGEAIKKLVANGRQPSECNSDELEEQKAVMAMICRASHRIAGHLMKIDPQKKGHKKIPGGYAYAPTAYSSFEQGVVVAIEDMKRKYATGCNTEHLQNYSCCYDMHHPVEGMKIAVEMPNGRTVEISLGKLIEVSQIRNLSGLDGNLPLDDLLAGTACELFVSRTMLSLDHYLWHFVWTHREEPELKGLFDDYGFVLDEGRLKYMDGKVESLLKKLEIKMEDFVAACGDDGHFVLPRSDAFVESVKEYDEKKKALVRKSARKRSLRRSSDGAPVADDGMVDGAEVEAADVAEVGAIADAELGGGTSAAEVVEEEAEAPGSNFEVASNDDDDDETEEEVKDLWWHELTAEDWKWLLECIKEYPEDIPIPDDNDDDDDDASETEEMQIDAESVSSRRMNKEVYTPGGALLQSASIPVAQGSLITNYREYPGESKKQKTDEDK